MTDQLPEPLVPADVDLPWRSFSDVIRPVLKGAIAEAARRDFISASRAEDLIQQSEK